MNEILYQIALFVVIVAGIALIFVLWRTYLILTDINDSTGVMRKRIREIDRMVSNLESSLNGLSEIIKGLAGSMDKVKIAKDKVKSFFETKEEKGSKNGGKFVLGAIIGAAAGAVAGLLFAPKSGKETRKELGDKAKDYADKAVDYAEKGKDAAVKEVKEPAKSAEKVVDQIKK